MTSAETRARLIDAAQDAICDLGAAGATAREITGRASANLAAIPYHFGSKDALVAEALIAQSRELIAPVLDLLRSESPASHRLPQIASSLNDLLEGNLSRIPGYLAALAATPHSPDVAAGVGDLWSDLRHELADDIGRQLQAGSLPGWVDAHAMAALILALVNGVVVAAVADPQGPDHHDVAAQFILLLLAASAPSAEDRCDGTV